MINILVKVIGLSPVFFFSPKNEFIGIENVEIGQKQLA